MVKLILKLSFLFVLLISLSTRVSVSYDSKIQELIQQVMKTQEISRSLKISPDYGKIPLYFIPNEGQVDEEALFYAKASRYTLWVTKEGLIFDSIRKVEEKNCKYQVMNLRDRGNPESLKIDRDVSRLVFLNSNNESEVIPLNQTEHRVNYFIGNDKSKWRTNIQTSRGVLYKGLYKNIDLKVYGMEEQIEYDFIVRPGGEVSDISFEYRDSEKTKIDEEGNLVIETKFGELEHAKPVCYQVIKGKGGEVEAEFKEIKKNTYGFKVKEYNKNYELIIDPLVLVYSTYLGGSSMDSGNGIAVDSEGAAYVTGDTVSTDFPTENPIDGTLAEGDAFITKINSSGNGLIYSTYLGGSYWDFVKAIAVDSEGAVYVTGRTYSTDFPTQNPIQGNYAGDCDAFITKINPSGTSLVYSTYLGGCYYDHGYSIAVDLEGAAYITGETDSPDFPTQNPIQPTNAGWVDIFITKINPSGTSLTYSTYLGGSDNTDYGHDIAVDTTGAAYVIGGTNSTDFPTKNPIQAIYAGDGDSFITKINASGTSVIYSTYLGGTNRDWGHGIAVDSQGVAYVTGFTYSADFPTKNPIQGYAGWDAFITKINSSGNALVYSTYLGGSNMDSGNSIGVDSEGTVYVIGDTYSTDFPITSDAYDITHNGEWDIFLTKLNSTGTGLIYSTYLGGINEDGGGGVAIDESGNAYVTGSTYSTGFPTTPGAYDTSYNGNKDAFITKLLIPSPLFIFDGHDFTGNGASDISVWRPTNGMWYIKGQPAQGWGTAGDIPVNGDYNGDSVTDIAVWRPTNGRWFVKGATGTYWGTVGDVPVPGDYNGDGVTDYALWRPSNGRWFVKGQAGAFWGTAGDIPVPGDYNGDGVTDIAVWRPSNGRWFVKGQAGSFWGTAGDIPVPGDYNGDGVTDIAVWRPSNGRWYIKGQTGASWGALGDIPLVR